MASKNKPKGKRKISKTASEDIENKNDAQPGEGEKPLLKRDAFICSTGHNAHLDEDYITDEMLLVGRKVRVRKRSGDRRSVDTRSLRSISSQVTLSSYDMPPSLPGTLERKHLQMVAEEEDAHGVTNAISQATLTDDQINSNDPRLNYSAYSNYLPQQHRRMHSYGSQTPVDRPPGHMEENYQRQSATSMPPLREGSDVYNTLDQLYKANFEKNYLTRRLSSTSINSQRGIPAGVRLFPRQSIVHPVGPFDDPSLAQDEGGSYAEAVDPKTGRSRLIKRDSIIHPNAELNQIEEGEGTMLNRRGSVIRPLTLEQSDEPKPRNSLTHVMQNVDSEEFGEQPKRRGEGVKSPPLTSALGALISKAEAQKMIDKNAYMPTVSSLVSPKSERLYMPLFINNRFENPWPTWKKPSVFDALQWKMTSKDNSGIPSEEKLNRTLPVKEPKFELSPPEKGIRVVWLGHATVLVRFDKLTVLTDPMFSERASPVGFMGPKRYRKAPCSINDLPKVDVVLISHNHYDHLDLASVQMLNTRFGAEVTWFVPLGLQPWMTSVGCINVVELSWWEKSSLSQFKDIEIVFTPAQHWCKRTPTDDNKVLWGSWCVLGPRHRFFFAGDTGYCDGFRQIGNKYGPFDLAAIPIGAYEPRWFMKYQHIDPDEAVMIHEDVRARQSIGIHWGTFALANEHYLEPPKKLHIALIRRNLLPHEFFTLNHGETKLVLREAELKQSTSVL